MTTYKMQSLHCNDCGQRLEERLKKLDNGKDIVLDFKKLEVILPDEVNEEQVKMIFAQEKIMAFVEEEMDEHDHHHEEEHHDEHGHAHSHSHNVNFQDQNSSVKNIKLVFFLNLFFSLFEVIFGLLFNSMAILSDAIHDFGDSVSVGLSWYFQNYSRKEASNRFSFGHQRFSLVGAMITATVLLVGSLFLLTRSIPRLLHPEEVNAEGMFFVALIAIAINGYAAWLLSRGSSKNEKVLNVHMLEDVLGWVGVLILSIVLRYTDWYILDPILSILISLFIFYKTLPLFFSTMHVFLEGVPSTVDLDQLEADILNIEDVNAVSHLHVWSIDGEENALNMTLFVSVTGQKDIERIKEKVRFFSKDFHVTHSTIEVVSDPLKITLQK